ncbi:MAG: 50S ribosomal protein L21 [Candidatus Zipacnadales bacterium]
MYAIARVGGRQVRVALKATIRVDRLASVVGDGVEFTDVLAIHNGDRLIVGTPYIPDAKVVGRIVAHTRGPKLRVRTYRPKKRTRRHRGHRQDYTMVEVLAIEAKELESMESNAPADNLTKEPILASSGGNDET